jgi:hypothetical protein
MHPRTWGVILRQPQFRMGGETELGTGILSADAQA